MNETPRYATGNDSTPCFRRATPLPAFGRACYHSGGLPPNSPASRRARYMARCGTNSDRSQQGFAGKGMPGATASPSPKVRYGLRSGPTRRELVELAPTYHHVVKTPQSAANWVYSSISMSQHLLQNYNCRPDAHICASILRDDTMKKTTFAILLAGIFAGNVHAQSAPGSCNDLHLKRARPAFQPILGQE